MRLGLALRAFYRTLFNAAVAEQVERALAGKLLPAPAKESPPPPEPPKPVRPTRSDALTLLAALQREARLIDFLREPLGEYSDAQIGAVARDIHRDCAAALERMFAVRPLADVAEGAEIELPAGFDAARYRLAGNVTGEPPYSGRVVHTGWQATRCEPPAWTGDPAAALVLAPVEVEL